MEQSAVRSRQIPSSTSDQPELLGWRAPQQALEQRSRAIDIGRRDVETRVLSGASGQLFWSRAFATSYSPARWRKKECVEEGMGGKGLGVTDRVARRELLKTDAAVDAGGGQWNCARYKAWVPGVLGRGGAARWSTRLASWMPPRVSPKDAVNGPGACRAARPDVSERRTVPDEGSVGPPAGIRRQRELQICRQQTAESREQTEE
ncbi:hypothetical protein V8F06_010424 [Rhypophila decipiens]